LEKLVRDRIPELMRASGLAPRSRRAKPEEVLDLLFRKLHEEVDELQEKPGVEELVDITEVLRRICEVLGVGFPELEQARLSKARSRGAFEDNVVLILD
jgi:predicted house-cleaning noncanonical NTP pyrophosphatase (MazG superfamily)